MSSAEDISKLFVQTGVMPNTLVGQNAVSKTYVDGELAERDASISTAQSSANTAQSTIDSHKASTVAHAASSITYTGSVSASTVKDAIDTQDQRITNIVAGAGASNTEIIDARQPATGSAFPVLRDRLNNVDAQLAENMNKALTEGVNVRYPPPPLVAAVGNGVTNDRGAFIGCAALGLPLIIPWTAEGYLLSGGFSVSNSVYGRGFPRLFCAGDGTDATRLIQIIDQRSRQIEITGLHLDGGYTGGTAGEQSHLVDIRGSSNVHVYGNLIERPYGDCVYIGAGVADPSVYSDNVHVYRNQLLSPRRCDVAVVSAKNVYIEVNRMTHPYGYVACIDLEQNGANDTTLDNITVRGNMYEGSTSSYFVNFYDPISRTSTTLKILDNIGSASYLFRVSGTGVGKIKDVEISGNTFSGTGRFITASSNLLSLRVNRNTDNSTGAAGWNLQNVDGVIISGNTLDANRASGMLLVGLTNLTISDNTFKNIFSSNGVLQFSTGNSKVSVTGNKFVNADYAIQIDGVISNALIGRNNIESARRAINIAAAANGSTLNVTADNSFTGAGTKIVGGEYANNQGVGYKTSVSGIPSFVGETAIVAGLVYIAKGTTSTADWVQLN